MNWLADYVAVNPNVYPVERLAEILTDLGLEVDGIEDGAAELKRMVVGFVVACEKHPKADKLSVCTVDVGEAEPRTIVCGAKNVAAGQYVCVALDGAIIPVGGFEIGKRTLRGVESNGMICSREELGADAVEDGIWVLHEDTSTENNATTQPPNLKIGMPLAEALGHTDVVLDIFITPNRSDCNSHRGVAREVLAYMMLHDAEGKGWSRGPKALNAEAPNANESLVNEGSTANELLVNEPVITNPTRQYPSSELSVVVEDSARELCPDYKIAVIHNVKVGPSPEWLQQRLTAVGLRPRNVVVDITNLINMDLGQPLHAFDVANLVGGIVLRTANKNEEFVTLDSKKRTVTEGALLICDTTKPVAIAGVMGGENSEITDATTTVVVESAYFNPTSIRRTSRKMALQTDASYRFERGVDPGNIFGSLHVAIELLEKLAGGTCSGITSVVTKTATPAPVKVRYERMRMITGLDVSAERQREMFTALGCTLTTESSETTTVSSNVTTENTDGYSLVTPPSWRVDLLQEIDFAEEVMRLQGINNVPSNEYATTSLNGQHLPPAVKAGGKHGNNLARLTLNRLMARGYVECYTGVLTSPELAAAGRAEDFVPVTLMNALGRDFSALRSTVVPQLLRVAAFNQHRGEQSGRYMELAKTYWMDEKSETGVSEEQTMSLLVTGDAEPHFSQPDRKLDIYDVMGDIRTVLPEVTFQPCVDTPGKPLNNLFVNTLDVVHGKKIIGKIAQILPSYVKNSDVAGSAIFAELHLRKIEPGNVQYNPVSAYPTVRRDLALIVDEVVTAGQLERVFETVADTGLTRVAVFDVYRDDVNIGKDKKSVGVALTFGLADRTMVDEEVDTAVRKLINAVAASFGAYVRGAE